MFNLIYSFHAPPSATAVVMDRYNKTRKLWNEEGMADGRRGKVKRLCQMMVEKHMRGRGPGNNISHVGA